MKFNVAFSTAGVLEILVFNDYARKELVNTLIDSEFVRLVSMRAYAHPPVHVTFHTFTTCRFCRCFTQPKSEQIVPKISRVKVAQHKSQSGGNL